MGRLLFGEWTPDQPAFGAGLEVASAVYPGPNGYRPVKDFVQSGGTLSGAPKGAASFTTLNGTSAIIAGTATGIYQRFGAGWTQLAAGYSVQADGRWSFAQFGGLAVGTNGADAMVKVDLDTGVTGPLGGSPPRAKILAVVKDFLVAGVVNDQVQTLAWSGINNAERWTFGQDQSDYQIMPSGGAINGILGGEYGIILQRNRISRMSYVGGNVLFQIDEISSNIGCITPNSVAQSGKMGFFLSDTGWQMWDGSEIKPIGHDKVDRTFFAQYPGGFAGMSAAVDPQNNVLIVAMPDQIWVYDYMVARWSVIPFIASLVFAGVTKDTSADEMDTIYTDLDAMGTVSFDDPMFLGGAPQFYLFNSAYALGTLSGGNMAAVIETGDIELTAGMRARLQKVRMLTDCTSGRTLLVKSKVNLWDAFASNSYSGVDSVGFTPVRDSGYFFRFRTGFPAGAVWTFQLGVDPVLAKGGRR